MDFGVVSAKQLILLKKWERAILFTYVWDVVLVLVFQMFWCVTKPGKNMVSKVPQVKIIIFHTFFTV